MSQHKDQRIGVFVDVQNLYYSAKHLYKRKVDFSQILKQAVNRRRLIRAIAYVIKADVRDEENFFEALEKIGFEVRAKDLQIFYGGHKKGDWDVGIAMDIMRLAGKLDVVVLISGDGDFKDLLEHVKALGCRAEVMAFGKTSSSRLKSVCDAFVDMDEQKNKFLIYQPRREFTPKGGPRGKSGDSRDARRDSVGEVSFMQKINMDQPSLAAKEKTVIPMPNEQPKQPEQTLDKKTEKIDEPKTEQVEKVSEAENAKPIKRKGNKPVKKKESSGNSKKKNILNKIIDRVNK
ncbi:NYN domain-containing protein [Candidatus Woesearchaeota archaeon]|nr:NYN domain-containing protein [Candidatus Woesearchaeota archaeon]